MYYLKENNKNVDHSNTTECDLSTTVEPCEVEYSPPIRMLIKKDGRIRYTPVSFERKLVKYDITMNQGIYPDGSLGTIWFNMAMDFSKNIINNRFEILDL